MSGWLADKVIPHYKLGCRRLEKTLRFPLFRKVGAESTNTFFPPLSPTLCEVYISLETHFQDVHAMFKYARWHMPAVCIPLPLSRCANRV